ncbi:hypothetical protein FH972_008758 [Carpinus fangiana]|uniref:RING-type domain-containing protein n=1 Tax=Carpinus fangiana TaxID=176857 RepID=A0A5N6R2R8_9ROSI|nr:hypothetical protein FH972_008758 [Carpinus fangiana]
MDNNDSNSNGNNAKAATGVPKPNNNNHNNDDGQEYDENPNHANAEEKQEEEEEHGVEEEEEEDDDDDGGEEKEGRGSDVEQPPQPPSQPSRTPFTNLSQVDADLALARTLQEQERAYMMLRMNNEGSDYGTGGDNNPIIEFDPAVFSSDEAYARALQDAEEREMAARLFALAGINDREADYIEDHGGNSQDTWEEVDPDELSYEELIALGEVVGTESRGLSADTIATLPSVNYKSGSSQNGSNDSCVICRLDYEDGETLTLLSCKHSYHSECINNWLKINKGNSGVLAKEERDGSENPSLIRRGTISTF